MSRVLLPVLCVAALLGPVPAGRAAEDDPKAVIVQAVKAHGGEETLAKFQAVQSSGKGKITLAGLGEVNFTQEIASMPPDKLKESLDLTVNGQNVRVLTLVNGDKMSLEANGTAIDLTDAIKSALKDAGYLLKVSRLVPLVREKGYEFSTVGEIKVEGKPAVGVRVSAKGQKDINLYFDKESHLLVKLEHRTVDPSNGNEVNEERIIQEYRKNSDGIQIPTKVLVQHDGKKFLEAEVEAKFLEKLDESEFKK